MASLPLTHSSSQRKQDLTDGRRHTHSTSISLSLTLSLTHSLTHSLAHWLTHSSLQRNRDLRVDRRASLRARPESSPGRQRRHPRRRRSAHQRRQQRRGDSLTHSLTLSRAEFNWLLFIDAFGRELKISIADWAGAQRRIHTRFSDSLRYSHMKRSETPVVARDGRLLLGSSLPRPPLSLGTSGVPQRAHSLSLVAKTIKCVILLVQDRGGRRTSTSSCTLAQGENRWPPFLVRTNVHRSWSTSSTRRSSLILLAGRKTRFFLFRPVCAFPRATRSRDETYQVVAVIR